MTEEDQNDKRSVLGLQRLRMTKKDQNDIKKIKPMNGCIGVNVQFKWFTFDPDEIIDYTNYNLKMVMVSNSSMPLILHKA